jgi:DNA replication protein DnaC
MEISKNVLEIVSGKTKLPECPESGLKARSELFQLHLQTYGYLDNKTKQRAELSEYLVGLEFYHHYREKYNVNICGLSLEGKNGTGKTFFMKFLSKFFNVKMLSEVEIMMEYQASGSALATMDWLKGWWNEKHLIIDEVGAREELKSYGNAGIMAEVFDWRYNRYKAGYLTFITTNMGADEIEARYGSRIRDRFAEMFTVITLQGESWRSKN